MKGIIQPSAAKKKLDLEKKSIAHFEEKDSIEPFVRRHTGSHGSKLFGSHLLMTMRDCRKIEDTDQFIVRFTVSIEIFRV